MDLTLDEMTNSELADLYHMMNDTRSHCSETVREIVMDWKTMIADVYEKQPKHTIVFKGQEVSILVHVAKLCIEHVHDKRRNDVAMSILKKTRDGEEW